MANVKKTVGEIVIKKKVDIFNLELTELEFNFIHALLMNIGGDPETSYRKIAKDLLANMDESGYVNDCISYDIVNSRDHKEGSCIYFTENSLKEW